MEFLRQYLPRASAAHVPAVGWLVGFAGCAAFALVGLALPATPFAALAAAVASTAVTAVLTGGAHEAGLAHAADALGAGVAPARALGIMKDRHLGSFGALALVLALLAKLSLLAVLAAQSPVAVLAALLCGHVVSRFWPLLLTRTLAWLDEPAAGSDAPFGSRIDPRALAIAAAWAIAALAVGVAAQGLAFAVLGVVLSGLVLLGARRLFAQRLQGFTKECVGALQQAGEIAFYLGAAIGAGTR